MDWKKIIDTGRVEFVQVKSPLVKSGLGSGGFSANPYVGCPHACMYCYVPCMSRGPADSHRGPWGTYLIVKQWEPIPGPVARNYVAQRITIGTATDPYMPLEPHFQRTHALLEELVESCARVTVITKSDLVLRDIELLCAFDEIMIAFSINTLDERFKDDMDAAPAIARRLEAMRACKDAGLMTSCFISPVFPMVTDWVEIIEAVRNNCDCIWLDGLNLQQGNLGKVTGYISAEYSWAFPLYRRMFRDGDTSWWLKESGKLQEYCRKQGLPYTRNGTTMHHSPLGKPIVVDFLYRCGVRRK